MPHMDASIQMATAPVDVFCSMRFHGADKSPMKEAFVLRELLKPYGVNFVIVEPLTGASMNDTVFTALSKCIAFVAMGSEL